jgi:hypothetical protein
MLAFLIDDDFDRKFPGLKAKEREMKVSIAVSMTLSALVSMGSTAFAAPAIVAEVTSKSFGMPPPPPPPGSTAQPFCGDSEMRVFDDGTVIASACEKKPTLVATLPASSIAKLNKLISLLPADLGKLEYDKDNGPKCQDGSDLTYQVMDAGQPVKIQVDMMCAPLRPAQGREVSDLLVANLKALSELIYLAK